MLKYHKIIISFMLFWLLFQLPFSFGVYMEHQSNLEKSINHIQTRLALDLPRLSLPDKSLNIVGDEVSVINYMKQFNLQLEKLDYSARIDTIKNISFIDVPNDQYVERILLAPGETITLNISLKSLKVTEYLSVMPLIFALLFIYLTLDHIVIWQSRKSQITAIEEQQPQQPILIIDLIEKVIINSETKVKTPLANKPLCFYVALSEFCTTNKEIVLNQNKDLPIELTELANKYFLRLIELGHTVRKRPNFSNSLEKTLSEIRAALDEVFIDAPDVKEIYYPPKAHGEGSRSKLHHYGLTSIENQHIQVIGK